MAATRDYDGIVLDLRMPQMAGDVVFEQLQLTAPAQAARVVFLTGDLQNESARTFLETAGRPIVHKPFLLDELGTVLLAQIPH
jgi:DNA-binding response OmpR family regulator